MKHISRPKPHFNLKRLLVLLFLVINTQLSISLPSKSSFSESFTTQAFQSWLVYNKSYGIYTPVSLDQAQGRKLLSQWIEIGIYRNHWLKINLQPNTTFYINNLLIENNPLKSTKSLLYPIDSLANQYSNTIFVSVYSPNSMAYKTEIRIVDFNTKFTKASNNSKLSKDKTFRPLIRQNFNSNNFIYLFLATVALIAIIKNVDEELSFDFLGFRNILYNNQIEDAQLYRLSNPIVLMIIALVALLTNFLIIKFNHPSGFGFINNQISTLSLFTNSTQLFAFFLGKYFFISFIAWIFKQSNIVKFHYFDQLKTILKIVIILSIGMSILAYFDNQTLLDSSIFKIIIIVIAMSIIAFRTILTTTKLSYTRNIYLFSYLCISEIMPIVFFFKYLVK